MYFSSAISPTNLFLSERSQKRAPYKGTFDYSKTYSDDTAFIIDPIILKVNTTINKKKPTHIFQTYNVFNQNQIAQIGGQTNPAENAVSVDIAVKPEITMSLPNVNYCINYALNVLAGVKSGVAISDKYVSDLSYTIDELNKKVSVSANINYFSGVSYTNLNLNWP